ncbi:MAG: sterol desaturase family protein [Flavobacteriales bacterium]|nr:sterol desaturase family protein [Flavobacteriales bacterium]
MKAQPGNDDGRIFQNPVLEALTRTHIAVPLVLFYGSGLAATWYAVQVLLVPLTSAVILFLAGMLFFTLVEYVVHRYVYHMETGSPRGTHLIYLFHGFHHDHPKDKRRLALPPVMTIVLAVLCLGMFRLLMGPQGFAFGGGFQAGYASYLFVHYAVHILRPPKNPFNVLWRHHNLHHFADNERGFGVSSPLWDHIFGTLPRTRKELLKERDTAAGGHAA